jgi:hypothetical protein
MNGKAWLMGLFGGLTLWAMIAAAAMAARSVLMGIF